MEKDKKIFNWILRFSILISPLLGMLLLDAPEGVEGGDAIFFKAAIGFGWGVLFGAIFSALWLLKRLLKI